MKLNTLKNNASKPRKRVGRGIGSGTGKTCGKGHKGQKSRSGVSIKGFEGGQMPIHRRLPKRGFTNIFKAFFQVVNVGAIQAAVDAKKLDSKKAITKENLQAAGLIRSANKAVKILGDGELKASVTLKVEKATKSATALIEKAGGKVDLITS